MRLGGSDTMDGTHEEIDYFMIDLSGPPGFQGIDLGRRG